MSGIDLRVKKLFRGKRNLVISALDHVLEYGDQPGIEDAAKAIGNCMATDALLMSRFMLRRHTDLMAGAEADICSLLLEEGDERRETESVRLFSEVVRQKERLGIPLVGECYVVEHDEIGPDRLQAKVKRVARILAELGADLLKCFFTGERFHEVVANTPVPIFTIGGEKLPSDVAVLEKAAASIRQGARGIVFGRNIFMAVDPPRLVQALNEVINDGAAPAEAAQRHGLR